MYNNIILDSAFRELRKDDSTCIINEILTQNGVKEVYFVGLAVEYGIQFNILDCNIFLNGINIYCISDGCKGFDVDAVKEIYTKFEYEKIHTIHSSGPEIQCIPDCESYLMSNDKLVNIVSCRGGNDYQLSDSYIKKGDMLWSDLKNKVIDIPDILQDTYYIKSKNNDNTNISSDFITITLKIKSKIYILWPCNNKRTNWLNKQYYFTNKIVNIENIKHLEVWEMKENYTSRKIIFGGAECNIMDKSHYNYIIAIKQECIYIYYNIVPDAKDVVNAIHYENNDILFNIINSSNSLEDHLPPLNRTPIHEATICGRLNAINNLIESDVNINVVDSNGETPLHLACRYSNNSVLN